MASIATLIDDFNDGVINSSLWVAEPGVAETGGHMVVTPSTAGPDWESLNFYDLTDSQVVFKIAAVTPVGTSGTLACGVQIRASAASGADLADFIKFGNDLYIGKRVGGVVTDIVSFTWNATTMAYWRFRESAGILYWDTSADGISWTNRHNNTVATHLFPITSVITHAYATYSGFEATPGTFAVDAVNPGTTITASGSSTSTGTAAIVKINGITASGSSTSTGSAAISIPPPGPYLVTATGFSNSTGSAAVIKLTTGQLTASALSTSSGSAALLIFTRLTGSAASTSTGFAALTIIPASGFTTQQYFTFTPPIAYDLPSVHSRTPRRIRSLGYYSRHSPNARGRTVLKKAGTYTTVDTPSLIDTATADIVYMGGHVHTVTQEEANSLSAAGYTVTPILIEREVPVVIILAPRPWANVDALVRVRLLVSEQVSIVAYLTGNGLTYPITVPSNSFSITTSDLSAGVYRLTFEASDLSRNYSRVYVDFNIFHSGGAPTDQCVFPEDSLYPSDSLYPILCDDIAPIIPIPSTTLLPSVTLLPGTP